MKHFAFRILLIFASLAVVSCNPCKRLAKLCPPSDSIAYIETIDTVIVTVPGSVSETEVSLGTLGLTSETENQRVEVIVKDSIVFIRTTCKEQEMQIFNLRKKLASQKTIIERVEIPKYVKKIPGYHNITGIIAPILLLILLFLVYLRFKSR